MVSETKNFLESALRSRELERFWDDSLITLHDVTPAQRSEARNFIVRLRDDLLQVAQSVSDPNELDTAWMLIYILLKSRWNLLNTRIGYEMADGAMNEELFCRAALVSSLVESIEAILDSSDIERALIFLEQPVVVDRVVSFLGRVIEPERALEVVLSNEALERTWDECLSYWTDSSTDQQAACRNFIVRLRDDLVQTVYRIPDPKEHPVTWTNVYVHVKSHWILLNTRIGYEMARGINDGSLFVRGALLSTLLEALEVNLRPEDVDRIDLYLNHPAMSGNLAEDIFLVEGFEERITVEDAEELPAALAAGNTDLETRVRHLNNTISVMKSKINRLEADKETLFSEIGESEPRAVIGLVRSLQKEILGGSNFTPAESRNGTYAAVEFGATREELAEKVNTLSDTLHQQRQELTELRTFRDTLALEVGKTDVREIIDLVRGLHDSLAQMRERMTEIFAGNEAFARTFGDTDPAQVATQSREMSLQIAALETELSPLRIARDLFVREFGKFDAVETVRFIHSMKDKLSATETEMAELKNGWEVLERELGRKDASEIIGLVRGLHDSMSRLQGTMEGARPDDELLEREFGTSDPQTIIVRFRELNEQITSFTDVAQMLGSMEEALKTLN